MVADGVPNLLYKYRLTRDVFPTLVSPTRTSLISLSFEDIITGAATLSGVEVLLPTFEAAFAEGRRVGALKLRRPEYSACSKMVKCLSAIQESRILTF